MKITEVRVIVTCPAGQSFVVVKVLTDEGIYGVGEGTKNGRELAVATLLEKHLAPTLIGRDPGAIEDIWKFLYKGAYWRGGPIEMAAIAAIDMALWDIKGKAANMPVYALLGGPTRTKLLTYAHTHGRDFQEAADEVLKAHAAGYKVIRSQVQVPNMPGAYGAEDRNDPAYQRAIDERLPYEGTWEPEPYLRIVPKLFEYLRVHVGWDMNLFHDAHGRLTPSEAARLLRDLEPYKLMYLEDPIGPEHAQSMRRVREGGTTPIAIGEIMSSRYEVLPMIVEQTIDYMRCSPQHVGGITEAKKLAAMGEPYDVRTAYHGPGDVGPIGAAASAHVGMAIPNFGIQEWTVHPERVREVMPPALTFEDGYLQLSNQPGLGVDINEELAAKYPYQRKYLPAPRRADGSMHGY
jgi:mannonate dehydratase